MAGETKATDPGRDESIIAAIEEEERRLAGRVAEANEEAKRIVSAAQAKAAARVAAFRNRLPRLLEERRREELARIEGEIELSRRQALREAESLRARIAERVEPAAELAARAVWPEGSDG